VAVVVALLVVFATRAPGPGLDPDGMAYVGAATSLVRQGTLRVPTGEWSRSDSTSALSFWPPGYPAAIAVPVSAGMTAIQGARVVNVIAAAVTALTVTLLVGAAVGTAGGVVAALVLFITPAVFDVHYSVLSEPLFITCLVLTLAAMVYARDRLLLLGLLSAMTVMVRYVGACAPAAVTLDACRRPLCHSATGTPLNVGGVVARHRDCRVGGTYGTRE
jgi:4-amino-4-deoxy-L-arabinose transferase-like glycosyltransferase